MACTLIYEQIARLGIHFPESPGIDEQWNEYKVERWGTCVCARAHDDGPTAACSTLSRALQSAAQ